ncbi:hypothetical protein ILYODFUR_039017, partial [Ilyodon furcidens]
EDEVSSSGHAQLILNEFWPRQQANRCLLSDSQLRIKELWPRQHANRSDSQSISCTLLFSLCGACCWPRFP